MVLTGRKAIRDSNLARIKARGNGLCLDRFCLNCTTNPKLGLLE